MKKNKNKKNSLEEEKLDFEIVMYDDEDNYENNEDENVLKEDFEENTPIDNEDTPIDNEEEDTNDLNDDGEYNDIKEENIDEINEDIKPKEKRKKKYRLKKSVLYLFIILIVIMVGITSGFVYHDYINSDKYILTHKGYTEEQVIEILKDKDKTKLLLERNYDEYILDIMDQKYYLSKNLEKYLEYKKENEDTKIEDVIAIINVGANVDWYDDIKETDTTKGILMLVNKFNYLDEDYEIDDLVDISIRYAFNGKKVREEVKNAYEIMAINAINDGLKLVANLTYRTYNNQRNIYQTYKNVNGTAYADNYAARAGHSEHQTGLALDISTLSSNADTFEDTEEFTWLIENAYKYGFILRYPKGKEYLTGYNYEAWHYRYVGKNVAKIIHDENITFDEYYAYYIDGE